MAQLVALTATGFPDRDESFPVAGWIIYQSNPLTFFDVGWNGMSEPLRLQDHAANNNHP